ncbi:MAG: S41 family peptidase, partial [Bacteroidota bacterium]
FSLSPLICPSPPPIPPLLTQQNPIIMKLRSFKNLLLGLMILSFPLALKAQNLQSASPEKSKQEKRKAEIEKIIEISEQHICNLNWLDSPEWKTFKNELQKPELLDLDLLAFKKRFRELARPLPFTHFYLIVKQKSTGAKKAAPPAFAWKAIDQKTALLTIRSFIADGPAMYNITQEIQAQGFENLIIDLRENGGGSLDAAVVLGQYLTQKPIDAGYYLTRQWFEASRALPTLEEVQGFPYLKEMTLSGFRKIAKEEAAFRMVIPGHERPIFEGPVYVLINSNTASTCEAFIALLQEIKRAKLVGATTDGAMLSGNYHPIHEKLTLFLPEADYLTAQGNRIDKVGVQPDIKVRSEEALEYTLEHLIK